MDSHLFIISTYVQTTAVRKGKYTIQRNINNLSLYLIKTLATQQ